MKFTLLVTAGPTESLAAQSAYRFASALLRNRHQITRLFFFSSGVENARANNRTDELPQLWQALVEQHHLPVTVCSGSAGRYGIDGNNPPSLPIGGLGDWLEAVLHSDRLVSFG